jgi:hypothetical protein
MTLAFRRISFARESGEHYYPFWRVEFEMDGKPQWRDVQAQEVYGAQQVICHELGVPFRPM